MKGWKVQALFLRPQFSREGEVLSSTSVFDDLQDYADSTFEDWFQQSCMVRKKNTVGLL